MTITTTDNTTIETTTHRTHWIEPVTGIRYEQHGSRHGLRPVLNLDEVREYVRLGLEHLPADPSVPPITLQHGPVVLHMRCATSVWYAHQVLSGTATGRTEHVLTQMAIELTDDVPRYHERWRAPFLASRAQFAAPRQAVQS